MNVKRGMRRIFIVLAIITVPLFLIGLLLTFVAYSDYVSVSKDIDWYYSQQNTDDGKLVQPQHSLEMLKLASGHENTCWQAGTKKSGGKPPHSKTDFCMRL